MKTQGRSEGELVAQKAETGATVDRDMRGGGSGNVNARREMPSFPESSVRKQYDPKREPRHQEVIDSARSEWIIPALVRRFLGERPSRRSDPS